MGAFDTPQDDIITIRNPKWESHESCRARTTVRVADEEWVHNQLVLIKQSASKKQRGRGGIRRQEGGGMDIQSQIGATNRLWVQRMLVDWTFTRGGLPMPLNAESIKLLRQDYLDYIYQQIQDAQPKDEEEDNDGEDEDGDEEGSSFFGNASDTTDGETSKDALLEDKPPIGMGRKEINRNYLSKS